MDGRQRVLEYWRRFQQSRGGRGAVGGGGSNVVTFYAAVAGGGNNSASGSYSMIPGGLDNIALGSYSFAAGRKSRANHDGAFVWADSVDADFSSVGSDSFNIRAGGGVYAEADNSTYGALFDNNGAGDGVRAFASTSKGNDWAALYAKNEGADPGIYAESTGGNTAHFQGDINVTGNVLKSAGGSKIDHPLDPENKVLYHNSVESSELKNVYDGVAVLDSNGEAWVELPEWFEALNGEFRYQLTCIGRFLPVYIAEEIENNRFKISGGNPNAKVCWQVTGVRRDPYAKTIAKSLVEEKPSKERGTYLHPTAYGLPRSKVVGSLSAK